LGTSGRSRVIINTAVPQNYKAEPGRQEWITVIECVCADGSSIEPLIIFKEENLSSGWILADFSEDWHVSNNSKGWTSMEHGLEWLRKCFEPKTREKAEGRWRLLICDGHDSHISAKFVRHFIDNDIILLLLPPHSSHLLQPLDVGVFKSLKAALTTETDRLFRSGLHRLQKVEWLDYFKKARPRAVKESNILGG
jgi:DDE superfamily endonuclease